MAIAFGWVRPTGAVTPESSPRAAGSVRVQLQPWATYQIASSQEKKACPAFCTGSGPGDRRG